MAYEKQTWSCGETITADKLNHMEDGIAEGGGGGNITFFPLTYDSENNCFSTTASYNDVRQAMESGVAYFKDNTREQEGIIRHIGIESCGTLNGEYIVTFPENGYSIELTATSATDSLSSCGGDQ